MAKQLQLRRGTTVQHNTFTGAVGEVTIDTDKDVVVVHDGATVGGFPSQKELVSGTNIKTINSTTILGSGNISVQPTLESGTNIKTINNASILGSGNLNVISAGIITGGTTNQVLAKNSNTDYDTKWYSVQEPLVSSTNIKTVNSTSLLGSGDVAVQATLVSGTNIKTVNSTSLLGSGDVAVQPTLVSGTNIKTIGGVSILGSGDINLNSYISLPTKVAYNQISVNGTTLTLTSPTAGTDYYFSKTAITTSIQSDTIGGFHYGLTPPGETPTGNKTSADITAIAGINAYSIWTNWHRPNCDPRGMVKVGDIWVDIYLADSRYGIRKYSAPTSITSYKIAGGTTNYGREIPLIPTEFGGNGSSNYGKLTWFQVNEIAKASDKRSLRYSEFPSAMYGVLEQTDSSSYDGGGGNIFHIAQLTSKFGIEQATGTQWVWGDDVQGIGGDGWKTGLTDSRGSIYAYTNQPTAVILGGHRGLGSDAGSRCSLWHDYVWNSGWSVGCRFACDHLKRV